MAVVDFFLAVGKPLSLRYCLFTIEVLSLLPSLHVMCMAKWIKLPLAVHLPLLMENLYTWHKQ